MPEVLKVEMLKTVPELGLLSDLFPQPISVAHAVKFATTTCGFPGAVPLFLWMNFTACGSGLLMQS